MVQIKWLYTTQYNFICTSGDYSDGRQCGIAVVATSTLGSPHSRLTPLKIIIIYLKYAYSDAFKKQCKAMRVTTNECTSYNYNTHTSVYCRPATEATAAAPGDDATAVALMRFSSVPSLPSP